MKFSKFMAAIKGFVVFSLILGAVSFILAPVSKVRAQDPEDMFEVQIQEDDIFDYDSESGDYDFDEEAWEESFGQWETTTEDMEEANAAAAAVATITALLSSVFSLVIGIGSYVFMAFTWSTIAKKLGYEDKAWMAWVPIANFILMLQIAEMSPWLIFLFVIPCIGWLALFVIYVIAWMKISERRGFASALGLITIIPIGAYVLYGLLAWGEGSANAGNSSEPKTADPVTEA